MRVDPFYVQGLVGSLNDAQETEAQLSGELSSGLRISSLSTDPVAAAQSTQIGAGIAADDSYVQAASTVQSKLQVTDSTLGEVVSQLTQALTLATAAGNSTLNSTDKSSIANQITQIQGQILTLANTSYLGEYIFAGSNGSTAPFVQSSVTSPATTTYTGDTAVQYTTTENGQKIQTNLPGAAVFTAPGSSVFSALSQIIADLNNNASGPTLAADSDSVGNSLKTVIGQRSVIDTSLAQVEATSTYAQTDSAQLTAAQSALLSANTPQIATQLSATETQSNALLSTIAALEKGSLFDYIR
jgi:flagellar hook-associated protein 3 FlgL